MASTNSNNLNCPNCNKTGLAILPVRYAVVPHSVDATLPEPLGNKVKNVILAHHKYALRTLRQGFVYLFYEKHARGSHIKWETYSVSTIGTLWKQLSIGAINSVSDDPACSRTGHNIPASVIAIERPEKCGKVWMAFSEHAWSMDTFKLFESDRVARDRRMQTFEPAKWISTLGYRHGLEANEANVGEVLEYKDRIAYNSILPTSAVPMLSKPDGWFSAALLKKQTTRYPFYNRKAQTKDLVTLMKKIGDKPTGKDNPPAIIALWDAVGITHELAGFSHDVLGWVDKYSEEREFQSSAMITIEGLKKALQNAAVVADTSYQRTTFERTAVGERNAQRRADALCSPEPQRSHMLEVCGIIDDWANKGLNYDLFEPSLMDANMCREPERSVQIKKIRAEAEQRVDKVSARTWAKYEEKLNKTAYENFQRYHQALHSAADKILDDRTGDLIAWLESKLLIAALTEFHTDNVYDGAIFEEQVGDAIYGMNGSLKGGEKIDEWVRQMKTGETNLVWRAIALNQKNAMKELDAALAEAAHHKEERTLASTLNWVNYATKSLKAFADTYKKITSLQNTNASASSATGSKAFGVKLRPVNMGGVDKLAASVGDRVFKAFRVPGLADHASEKIIQHIFAVRAFVSPGDSADLIEAQAKNEGLARRQQLKRLGIARNFMAADTPAIRTAQSEALKKAWQDFKTKNPGGASVMKDARLAVVVMLIEGVNFNKLIADCAIKNDAKSWWSLAASGVTITSTLFDAASVPAKSLFGAESWSYQRLKLAGGLLGSAASVITAVLDLRDALKVYGKGNTGLAVVYLAKSGLGVASAGFTAAATFTYAAPLISRLTGKAALSAGAQVVSARVAAVIGFRILFMSVGAWVTVAAFGLQIFAWVIVDDALEVWCSLCAFGDSRTSRDAYRTTKAQASALEKALVELG